MAAAQEGERDPTAPSALKAPARAHQNTARGGNAASPPPPLSTSSDPTVATAKKATPTTSRAWVPAVAATGKAD
ncbi:MAG: hypothetical protein U1F77_00725 [Kiritimatiellia bacterium]